MNIIRENLFPVHTIVVGHSVDIRSPLRHIGHSFGYGFGYSRRPAAEGITRTLRSAAGILRSLVTVGQISMNIIRENLFPVYTIVVGYRVGSRGHLHNGRLRQVGMTSVALVILLVLVLQACLAASRSAVGWQKAALRSRCLI